MAQSIWRRATGWTAVVQFPAGERDFSLHSVQTALGPIQAHNQQVLPQTSSCLGA
jgi:hypothetical protein